MRANNNIYLNNLPSFAGLFGPVDYLYDVM